MPAGWASTAPDDAGGLTAPLQPETVTSEGWFMPKHRVPAEADTTDRVFL